MGTVSIKKEELRALITPQLTKLNELIIKAEQWLADETSTAANRLMAYEALPWWRKWFEDPRDDAMLWKRAHVLSQLKAFTYALAGLNTITKLSLLGDSTHMSLDTEELEAITHEWVLVVPKLE